MIALVEAVDRDGSVRQAWRVERWPLTIGRALDNDVVLSDPHVAAHHARIDAVAPDAIADGDAAADATAPPPTEPARNGATTLVVSAGASVNGVGVGKHRLAAGARRAIADDGRDLELHVGRTVLRLRLPGHPLAPEQALAPIAGAELRWPATLALAATVLLGVLLATWLATDPDNLPRAVGAAVLTTLAFAALWCGAWALLSKIFARQSYFAWHVRVAVGAGLLLLVLSALPSLIAFAFSAPAVSDFAFVAVYAVVAGAIYLHLLAVEPGRRRLMRAVAAVGFVVAVALSTWFNVQRTGRAGEELYMNHLFPPALRLAEPIPVDRFVEGLAPMQSILDRQAKDGGGGGALFPEGEDE